MNIRAITQFEFDTLFPSRPTLESYTGRLVEWYASEDNNILGAVDHERMGAWSYVVLKRNANGALRVTDIQENLISTDAARLELFQKMEVAGEDQ